MTEKNGRRSESSWVSTEDLTAESNNRLQRVAGAMLTAAMEDREGTEELQVILMIGDSSQGEGTLVSAGLPNASSVMKMMLAYLQGTAEAEGFDVRVVPMSGSKPNPRDN